MTTPDDHRPPDQPIGPDAMSEPATDGPTSRPPDETFVDAVREESLKPTSETTAEFESGWKDNLVAYLDGELTEQDMQELDEVLRQHPDARANVEELRQTWDLLDVLPRPAVTEAFSAQTLATIRVVQDEEPAQPTAWRRRLLLALLLTSLLTISAVAGVLLVDRWQPDPTVKLITQLSVIERFGPYDEIGDLGFLEALEDTKRFPRRNEFNEPIPKDSILLQPIPESREDRWQYIADLPQDRRKRLTKNSSEFQALKPVRQRELFQLDARITQSTDLATTAADYYHWLKTLQPWQRDEIRKSTTTTEEKISLILKHLDQQEQQDAERSLGGSQIVAALGKGPSLSSEDFSRVITTVEQQLPPSKKQQLANQGELDGTSHALSVLELSAFGGPSRGGPGPRPPRLQERVRPSWPDSELATEIISSIKSPEIRSWLTDSEATTHPQIRLGLLIIRSLAYESFREIRRKRASDRELQEYFVGLSPEMQDDLMRLPPSEFERQVQRRLYLDQNPDAIGFRRARNRFLRLLGHVRSPRGGDGGRRRFGPGPDRPPPPPTPNRQPGGTR